jgi:LysM repeat protein
MKSQPKMNLPKPPRRPKSGRIYIPMTITDEGVFNQHEPNVGMARLFVVMVMIHVVVIGGIIVYDYLNSPVAAQRPARAQPVKSHASALPPPAISDSTLEKELPIEDYATYEWRSGDSIPKVAEKLKVPQDVLIRLNMLDKGAQLDQNTILRYPRQPVVRAVSLAASVPPAESLTRATQSVDLPPAAAPTFSFAPTIVGELARAPELTPGRLVQSTPPAPAEPVAAPQVQDQPPAAAPVIVDSVPKAIPVQPEQVAAQRPKPTQPAAKPTAVAAKPAAKASLPRTAATHTVKLGDNLHRIASRHQISVKALQEANKLSDPNHIREGMKLVIPTR